MSMDTPKFRSYEHYCNLFEQGSPSVTDLRTTFSGLMKNLAEFNGVDAQHVVTALKNAVKALTDVEKDVLNGCETEVS
ncbi:hypothetical protein [Aneurinibacillus aneurinilyticus]|uniref:hypothetical protein n=1 Tax=Aneurinibacillus aneurinilyticus TaxID=1391 RepID=UPI0023F1EEEA|nr:hypothetical protein [Aneurinibacillus aneurinilyticus]